MLFFTGAMWLQILVVVAALPLVCLLLGVLVCVFDPTATGMFEGARWYQIPLGLMLLGEVVAVVPVVMAGLCAGMNVVDARDYSGIALVTRDCPRHGGCVGVGRSSFWRRSLGEPD